VSVKINKSPRNRNRASGRVFQLKKIKAAEKPTFSDESMIKEKKGRGKRSVVLKAGEDNLMPTPRRGVGRACGDGGGEKKKKKKVEPVYPKRGNGLKQSKGWQRKEEVGESTAGVKQVVSKEQQLWSSRTNLGLMEKGGGPMKKPKRVGCHRAGPARMPPELLVAKLAQGIGGDTELVKSNEETLPTMTGKKKTSTAQKCRAARLGLTACLDDRPE